jgi:hypothetical protein
LLVIIQYQKLKYNYFLVNFLLLPVVLFKKETGGEIIDKKAGHKSCGYRRTAARSLAGAGKIVCRRNF